MLHTSDTAESGREEAEKSHRRGRDTRNRSVEIRLVGRFSLWGDRDWLDKPVAAGRFLCTVHLEEVLGIPPCAIRRRCSPIHILHHGSCLGPPTVIWYWYHSAGTVHGGCACTVPRLEPITAPTAQEIPEKAEIPSSFGTYHGIPAVPRLPRQSITRSITRSITTTSYHYSQYYQYIQ